MQHLTVVVCFNMSSNHKKFTDLLEGLESERRKGDKGCTTNTIVLVLPIHLVYVLYALCHKADKALQPLLCFSLFPLYWIKFPTFFKKIRWESLKTFLFQIYYQQDILQALIKMGLEITLFRFKKLFISLCVSLAKKDLFVLSKKV